MTKKPELDPGIDWVPEAVRWYDHLRDLPETDSWNASDWDFAQQTAILVGFLYGSNDCTVLPELMKREQYMGIHTFGKAQPKPASSSEKGKLLSLVIGEREKRSAAG